MIEQLNSVFFDEANELLDNLEDQLLTLGENPTDKETISAVFRAMHTIKGSAAMFGFNEISSFTHEVESAMDQVRNGIIPVTSELIDLTLKARDFIRLMLNAGTEISEEMKAASENLILEFKVYITKHGGSSGKLLDTSQQKEHAQHAPAAKSSSWRIKFRPSRNIMKNGTRPELLVKELTEMGSATVTSFYHELPPLSEMDGELCYFFWDVILTTTKTENDIKDVFIFLDSESTFEIEKIDLLPGENTKIGEILVNRGALSQGNLDSVLNAHKQIGQILIENNMITEEQVQSALAEQRHLKSLLPTGQVQSSATTPQQTVRINSEKLDELVDLVGELVTFNARLEQQAILTDNATFKNLSEQCMRISVRLRESSMGLRMVPINTLFSRFRRTVHDLANQLGKSIELTMEGAETELDKTVVEKLNDPLLHLIRNCVDHGIEMPCERSAEGKDILGHITLSAKHIGAFILITITDDGRGLDKDAIREKGIQKGLISESDVLSDSEIFNLIFQPGFSTAKQVSSISGRGVGLDVVKKDITALGGTVSIETEKKQGTSFILKLPLTLAIIDGMLTTIEGIKYIIPLNTIAECMTFQADPKKKNDVLISTTLHGKDLNCINLRKFFGIDAPYPVKQEIVAVYDNDRVIGLAVDKILGSNQTVIKPIGKLFNNCTGINGSSILGDGSVALILDVLKLTELLRTIEKERE